MIGPFSVSVISFYFISNTWKHLKVFCSSALLFVEVRATTMWTLKATNVCQSVWRWDKGWHLDRYTVNIGVVIWKVINLCDVNTWDICDCVFFMTSDRLSISLKAPLLLKIFLHRVLVAAFQESYNIPGHTTFWPAGFGEYLFSLSQCPSSPDGSNWVKGKDV